MKCSFQHSILIVLFFYGCNNKSGDPVDPISPEDRIELSACLTDESADVFEVLTWNIENFPMENEESIKRVVQIIEDQKPDLIAFQEMSDQTNFDNLNTTLVDYDGQLYISGNINLGFYYKKSEVTLNKEIEAILNGDSYAFPREPVTIEVSHKNGMNVTFINIHLKCCDGTDNYKRRKEASAQLKNYIDAYLPEDRVVLLGDFNDEIYGIPDYENPFVNFIDDSINFEFADMKLAQSDRKDWSYPSWPSHIDHILISNELFDNLQETITLSYDQCFDEYFDVVSDHRPVMIKLIN